METTQITVTVFDKTLRETDIVKIHAAAAYFAFRSRELQQIAKAVDVSEQTIRRWRDNEPEWEKTFQTIGYKGTRLFKKKHTRNAANNVPKSKRKTIVWKSIRSLLRILHLF